MRSSKQPKRFRIPDGVFRLSEEDIAALLYPSGLEAFLIELVAEIELAYRDRSLALLLREGWDDQGDALEVMGCRGSDYTVIKTISSNPSIASRDVPTVSGDLYTVNTTTKREILKCEAPLLTALRTAAGTYAVLRQVNASFRRVTIIGAGLEGETHAAVLGLLGNSVERISFVDLEPSNAVRAASQVRDLLRVQAPASTSGVELDVIGRKDVARAYDADVIVTATYGQATVVHGDRVREGTFIAAVGADLEGKRELDDAAYEKARFVADDLGQCLRQGELQYAAGIFGLDPGYKSHVGSLAGGRVISVRECLRSPRSFAKRDESIVVYDSTGFSGQDLAAVRTLLRLLCEAGWPTEPWKTAASLNARLTPRQPRYSEGDVGARGANSRENAGAGLARLSLGPSRRREHR